MAEFNDIPINTTAERIERIANMDINAETLDASSDDSSLPTSKVVYEALSKAGGGNVDQTYNPESENAQSGKAVAEAIGNIETALDNIISIQNALIGGDGV